MRHFCERESPCRLGSSRVAVRSHRPSPGTQREKRAPEPVRPDSNTHSAAPSFCLTPTMRPRWMASMTDAAGGNTVFQLLPESSLRHRPSAPASMRFALRGSKPKKCTGARRLNMRQLRPPSCVIYAPVMSQATNTVLLSCGLMAGKNCAPPPPGPMTRHWPGRAAPCCVAPQSDERAPLAKASVHAQRDKGADRRNYNCCGPRHRDLLSACAPSVFYSIVATGACRDLRRPR